MSLRHSMLPKVAACACYQPSGGSSPAAQRGTNMDAAYRAAISGNIALLDQLADAEKQAVQWAIETTLAYCVDTNVIVDEEQLKVKTSGMDHVGTEDARIPKIQMSLDLKTGQIRNYMEQMAAYALGNMETYFVDKWTCILLFCDSQTQIVHEFTHDEAKAIVAAVISAYNDPNKQPTPCEYCGWCLVRNTCPAIVKPTSDSLAVVEKVETSLEQLREQVTSNPEQLGHFLKMANIFKKELWDYAKDKAKDLMAQGVDVAGWKISTTKGSEYFTAEAIAEAAETTGASINDIIDLFGGEIDGKTFRAWADKRGYTPSSLEAKTKQGTTRMTETKPKRIK